MNNLVDAFSRKLLGQWPTPLQEMLRFNESLNGPRVFVKRDDCSGLATGGNKTRKLEFLVGDAIVQGADTLITLGAVQSNHTRQTAAAAACAGLHSQIVAVERVPIKTDAYRDSGNVLLSRLFGAVTHRVSAYSDFTTELSRTADAVRELGGKPYMIPFGGSNAIGALGYVQCAVELLHQFASQGLKVDRIVHASGSAGTQAGLLAGLRAMGSEIQVLGVSVVEDENELAGKVLDLAQETAELIGHKGCVVPEDVNVTGEYVGDAYGIPTEKGLHAIETLAGLEGLLLDPVYTGKAMAGLIDHIHRGLFSKDQTVVFLHTGGSVALFSYIDHFRVTRSI